MSRTLAEMARGTLVGPSRWLRGAAFAPNEDTLMTHNTSILRMMGTAVALTLFAATTAMAHPGSAIVVDRLGQIWFLDTGDGLWKIDTHGALIRIGGNRFHWMALDQDNRFTGATLPRGVTRVGGRPTLLIASDFRIVMGGEGILAYPSV